MIIQCKKLLTAIGKEELDSSPFFTIGKKYIVLCLAISYRKGISGLIISDSHYSPVFPDLDGFEIVSQKIPKSWGMKLEDDIFHMMPKSWMYPPSFFEDVEDGKSEFVDLFRKEIALMYEEEGWSLPSR